MISATALATGAAVKLFTKGALLAIAIYTAGRANNTDMKETGKHPQKEQ